MLQLSASLTHCPVLSLRTGTEVATTIQPIINPNNLKIEGFYCDDYNDHKRNAILLYQDIREVLPQGIVVNDYDVLVDPEELIRLQDILNLQFVVLGKQVTTVSGDKVGKVTDFSVEVDSMLIQKLYVTQSLLKNLIGSNLGIDRTQIVEITDKKIVIQDLLGTVPAGARATA
jgi:uncharacterized protein YrrD